jgi:hypothetical protein
VRGGSSPRSASGETLSENCYFFITDFFYKKWQRLHKYAEKPLYKDVLAM